MTPHGEIVTGLTWAEALRTDYRDFLEEQANPSQYVVRNMTRHAQTFWAPMRARVGPTMVTSGYRCEGLNHAIGGAANSRHVRGLATDNVPLRMDLVEAFQLIAWDQAIMFDVLIFELGRWIHGQSPLTSSATPRRILLMNFEGKTEPWDPADPRVQQVRRATPITVNGVAHVETRK